MRTHRLATTLTAVALLALVVSAMGAFPAQAVGRAGTTLSTTVDITPHWARTFTWAIDKAATPDLWDLFQGDSGTSEYTISVTKDEASEAAWVDGQICVTNGGEVATEGLTIVAVLLDGYGPPNEFLTSAPVDVSGNPVLDPGETECYAYHVDIPITDGPFPQPHVGGTYKVTADVTITNHSGYLGVPFGPSPSATTVFPTEPTVMHDSITVEDSNGDSWSFSDDDSVTYTKTFTCDDDDGMQYNTATIRYDDDGTTGPSATALVDVRCAQGGDRAGTTLSATVDLTPHWARAFTWAIDKAATPDLWDLFQGDSGTSEYTISVTKDEDSEAAWVDGQICVTNGGEVATEGLTIVAVLLDGYGPPNEFLTSAPVDVSGNPVLDPGETECYAYHVDIPIIGGPFPQPHAGGMYKMTADVTITNHSGHLGVPFGPGPSATTVFPTEPTVMHDSITVEDSNGDSWSFSDDDSVTYTKTFFCDDDDGMQYNTATIRYDDDGTTGPSATALVDVYCYVLDVSKDANTSLAHTYNWTIDKSADQSSLTLLVGQQSPVNYSVMLDAVPTDSDWAVSGNISVYNPSYIDATINSVSDVVADVSAATVDCGVSFPYTLPADNTLNCTYSLDLPDASDRSNTATATLQNHAYDVNGVGTPLGTTDFSGSAAVSFENASVSEVDECVDVTDSYTGSLGTVCAGDAPKTFTYSWTIGPYSTCGEYTVENTASFVANDTGATGGDSWTIDVSVPCAGGCSLTIGYWKTHAGFGPQADRVTPLLPQLLGASGGAMTQNVTTAGLAVQFLSFKGSNNVFDAANGINKLYAQLLGAKLNIANGAGGSAVASTIASADAFLANKDSLSWSSLSKAQKNQVLAWATTLDNYNNGLIGPGHCSE